MEDQEVTDFCSVQWAAKQLRVGKRTVLRYVEKGLLAKHIPRTVDGERLWLLSTEAVKEMGRFSAPGQWERGRRG